MNNDLLDIANDADADFIFISEPHLFQCDLVSATMPLSSSYKSFLNSDDLYNHELPLTSNRAFGGTLSLWKNSLDPFVKILHVNTSCFLPLLLKVPGHLPSVHINIYLPTAGLTTEYVSALSGLENLVEEILEEHGDIHIFIRGDANAAVPPRPNNARDKLFQYFCERMSLVPLPTNHTTYHHFMGGGSSDSSIDVLLQRPAGAILSENIKNIFCSKNDPRVDSKHDAIVSTFHLPILSTATPESTERPLRCQIPSIRFIGLKIGSLHIRIFSLLASSSCKLTGVVQHHQYLSPSS